MREGTINNIVDTKQTEVQVKWGGKSEYIMNSLKPKCLNTQTK